MSMVDWSVLERHRAAVERIEAELAEKQERERIAAREKAVKETAQELTRLQSFFGLPTDPIKAEITANRIVKE